MVMVMEGAKFDIAKAMSQALDSACSTDAGSHVLGGKVTPFTAQRLPTISPHDYLLMMRQGFYCSDACYILCIVYIERIVERNSSFVVGRSNVHRLLLAALVVAAKFHDDIHGKNRFYAKVGGVTTPELAVLEAHVMVMLDWKLYVTPDEYNNCFNRLRCQDASLCLPTEKVEVAVPLGESGRTAVDAILHESVDTESETSGGPDEQCAQNYAGSCQRRSRKRRATSSVDPQLSKRTRIYLTAHLYLASVAKIGGLVTDRTRCLRDVETRV